MTRTPPRPLLNRYMRIPIIRTTNHLLLNSRALILIKPLFTRAINEKIIANIPQISDPKPKSPNPGRIVKGMPITNRIPWINPIRAPMRISKLPICFKSANLTISPCYGAHRKGAS